MLNKRFAKGRVKLKEGEYQRPNGTFEYKWTDRFGKRHSVYAKTIPALRAKEEKILRDTLDGIGYVDRNQTINSYFAVWKKIKSGIRESTFITYLRLYQRYIEPQFGNTVLKDLSYSKVVMFYKDLIEKRGLSVSSASNVNVVLGMILDLAIKDGALRTNPCTGAMKELQRKYADTVKEVKALTSTEQALFEDFISKPGIFHCLEPIITVMLYTGMRVGEVVALKHSDFDGMSVRVQRSETRYRLPSGRYEYVVQDHPKTDAGFRTIIIPDSYKWVVDKLKRCNPFGEWLFVKRDKKTRITTNTIRTRVRGICKELDIPVRSSHKIRKTYGTILLDNNIDSKLIQSQMGHTNIQVTENYYHRDRKKFDQKKRIIDSIEEFKKTAN